MMPGAPDEPPPYWKAAKRALLKRDPVLAKVIQSWGEQSLRNRGDPFQTLARAIVGQQISVAAAQTIWGRVLAKALETSNRAMNPDQLLLPKRVLALRTATLRACGLSERKAEYLKDLARAFESKSLNIQDLMKLSDEEVIQKLTAVRGVGRWTAEIFLMFNLNRPDVFPLDDVGLLRAITVNYCQEYDKNADLNPLKDAQKIKRADIRSRALVLGELWKPWRSAAAWYLWRSLEAVPLQAIPLYASPVQVGPVGNEKDV